MGRSVRYLTFDGQFESSLLGTFRIIRSFANLKDARCREGGRPCHRVTKR
jgi:hypothetical protein